MFFPSTRRILKFSWQHFWRNIWLSLATIIIIILTLFSLTTLVLVNVVADRAVNSIKETIDVSLYFDNQMTEESIQLLQTELKKIEEIKDIEYISPDQALEKFKQDHKDDEEILASIAELDENPLGGTLILTAHHVDQYPLIMERIQEAKIDELAESIDYEDHQLLIGRINNFTDKVRSIGLILSLMFVFISLVTVFNTVRMGIYIHRKEISIMRLVGASNWFIRLPFIIEGIFYALFGCIIFWILLFVVLHLIGPWVNSFLIGINFNIQAYLLSNIVNIFGFELIIIIIINTISAMIAMGRYLKV